MVTIVINHVTGVYLIPVIKNNRFLHESLLKIWGFFHECEKFVFSRVGRSGTSGKTLNFFHEWKKSQIFNKDECKYVFLPFQLKKKHADFIHSFACQCHVYYTKYYNATCNAVNRHLFKTALNLLGEIS